MIFADLSGPLNIIHDDPRGEKIFILLSFYKLILGSFPHLSVIVVPGYKSLHWVSHLHYNSQEVTNDAIDATDHVEVGDIAPHLCKVGEVHVSGVDDVLPH